MLSSVVGGKTPSVSNLELNQTGDRQPSLYDEQLRLWNEKAPGTIYVVKIQPNLMFDAMLRLSVTKPAGVKSVLAVPGMPDKLFVECSDPAGAVMAIEAGSVISEIGTGMIPHLLNEIRALRLHVGRIVRIGNLAHDRDPGQIVDVDAQKGMALVKLWPRIDYDELKNKGVQSQRKLNTLMPREYMPPSGPFDAMKLREIGAVVSTGKMVLGQSLAVDVQQWDGMDFVGDFLYMKVPFSSILTDDVVSEEEIVRFRNGVSSFEQQNREFMNNFGRMGDGYPEKLAETQVLKFVRPERERPLLAEKAPDVMDKAAERREMPGDLESTFTKDAINDGGRVAQPDNELSLEAQAEIKQNEQNTDNTAIISPSGITETKGNQEDDEVVMSHASLDAKPTQMVGTADQHTASQTTVQEPPRAGIDQGAVISMNEQTQNNIESSISGNITNTLVDKAEPQTDNNTMDQKIENTACPKGDDSTDQQTGKQLVAVTPPSDPLAPSLCEVDSEKNTQSVISDNGIAGDSNADGKDRQPTRQDILPVPSESQKTPDQIHDHTSDKPGTKGEGEPGIIITSSSENDATKTADLPQTNGKLVGAGQEYHQPSPQRANPFAASKAVFTRLLSPERGNASNNGTTIILPNVARAGQNTTSTGFRRAADLEREMEQKIPQNVLSVQKDGESNTSMVANEATPTTENNNVIITKQPELTDDNQVSSHKIDQEPPTRASDNDVATEESQTTPSVSSSLDQNGTELEEKRTKSMPETGQPSEATQAPLAHPIPQNQPTIASAEPPEGSSTTERSIFVFTGNQAAASVAPTLDLEREKARDKIETDEKSNQGNQLHELLASPNQANLVQSKPEQQVAQAPDTSNEQLKPEPATPATEKRDLDQPHDSPNAQQHPEITRQPSIPEISQLEDRLESPDFSKFTDFQDFDAQFSPPSSDLHGLLVPPSDDEPLDGIDSPHSSDESSDLDIGKSAKSVLGPAPRPASYLELEQKGFPPYIDPIERWGERPILRPGDEAEIISARYEGLHVIVDAVEGATVMFHPFGVFTGSASDLMKLDHADYADDLKTERVDVSCQTEYEPPILRCGDIFKWANDFVVVTAVDRDSQSIAEVLTLNNERKWVDLGGEIPPIVMDDNISCDKNRVRICRSDEVIDQSGGRWIVFRTWQNNVFCVDPENIENVKIIKASELAVQGVEPPPPPPPDVLPPHRVPMQPVQPQQVRPTPRIPQVAQRKPMKVNFPIWIEKQMMVLTDDSDKLAVITKADQKTGVIHVQFKDGDKLDMKSKQYQLAQLRPAPYSPGDHVMVKWNPSSPKKNYIGVVVSKSSRSVMIKREGTNEIRSANPSDVFRYFSWEWGDD